jgi:LPXTG-motif cell wall-anchored protein
MGGANKPGEGHVHVLVDGAVVGMIAAFIFEVKELANGTRKITIELVNNDHTSRSPAVSDSVWVEVSLGQPGGPSLEFLKPTANQKFTTQDVPVEFSVKNFKLVQPTGQANQQGAGHIHLIVDGGAPIWIWNNSQAVYALKLGAGAHTLKGVLVNNDHSSVPGAAEVSVSITVELDGQKPAPDNTGLFLGIGLLLLLLLAGLLLLLLRRRRKEEGKKAGGEDEAKEAKKESSGAGEGNSATESESEEKEK